LKEGIGMTMTISERIGEFVSQIAYDDLPKSVVKVAKRCILDWLGAGYRGSKAEASSWVLDLLRGGNGKEASFLTYPPSKGNFLFTAFSNAFFSHILEIDDVHRGSIFHPASPVISAAFSQAESLGASGKELITSVVLGYEVSIRVAECLGLSHYKYWHPTATAGVFGSAVAGAKLLKLDPKKVAFALGNAGTSASGLWQFNLDGAMTKPLHPAKAAMEGLISANLAYRGFSGALRIFEGEKGICNAMARDGFDLEKLLYGLGSHWKTEEVSLKPYPCCRHIHPSIDAAKEVHRASKLKPQEIASVKVYTYRVGMETAHFKVPTSLEEARFSISYCVALALKFGDVNLDLFSPSLLRDEEILSLIDKTEVLEDDVYTKNHPQKWGAKVEVLSRDGGVWSSETWFPLGDPEKPMSDREVEDKFKGLVKPVLPEDYLSELIGRVWSIEEMENIRSFFEE